MVASSDTGLVVQRVDAMDEMTVELMDEKMGKQKVARSVVP